MKKMKTVKLISKGYTWDCPNCRVVNNEEDENEIVECINCNSKFLSEIEF